MANWLLDPAHWSTDTGGPPPPNWNGTAYAFNWPSINSNRVNFLQVVAPAPGTDNIAGTVTFVDQGGFPVFLVYASDSSGTTIYGSVPVAQGVPTPFDFPAQAGTTARLYIANGNTPGSSPAYYYGVTATVSPAPIPAVGYNCECDDDYPQKTLAQMREFLMIRLGWAAMKNTALPGVNDTLNSFLVDAQEQIYRQYKVFRLERYFTWDMEPGVRFYDLLANRDECTKKLDPRMVTWVGVSQEQNTWRPLVCGIRPTMYWGEIESIPTHYEIRQCIEVWPAPQDATWQLRVKGYFGLLPLVLDTDINTVDYEAIQLYALANAKAHYGQPDAANYMAQYREYVSRVTAGSHHTRRYVPGGDDLGLSPPLPVLTGYPGDP